MTVFVPENAVQSKTDALLRKLCLEIPGVEERLSWGHPTYRTKRCMFAAVSVYGGGFSVCLYVGFEAQMLLLEDPRFIRPPYVGHKGWVALVVADAAPKTSELRALVLRAHEQAAAPAPRPKAKSRPKS